MALQILSDLHLESPKAYDIFEIVPKAPYLALLGDVGNIVSHKDDCLAFLTRQLRQFRAVLFVPGNHEAYHSNWPDTLSMLRTFEQDVRNDASLGDFILLHRGVFEIADSKVTILGCSLFSCIPSKDEQAISFGLNDFFHIDNWDVNAHNEAHARDLAWLNDQVTYLSRHKPDTQLVILTHWSPTRDERSADPKNATSPIASGFSTDLSDQPCFESGNVKVWGFGHTHWNCDFEAERKDKARPLRLLTNQRGYYFKQAERFDEAMVIKI